VRGRTPLFGVTLALDRVHSRLKVSEIGEILKREYGKDLPDGSLDTEGERLIASTSKPKLGSPFVFATHYPATARPMYSLRIGGTIDHPHF
jgi:nondiscriminating aspartyl-tRNA synthetase